MTSRPLPLLLVALLLLAPAVSAGEVWEKRLGEKITAVATDERGDRIFVGTESGQLIAYNSNGDRLWTTLIASGPIDKIVATEDGEKWFAFTSSPVPAAHYGDVTGSVLRSIEDPEYQDFDVPTDGAFWIIGRTQYTYLRSPESGVLSARISSTATQISVGGAGNWAVSSADSSTLTLYSINHIPNWLHNLQARKSYEYSISGVPEDPENYYNIEIRVVRGSGTDTGNTVYIPDCRSDFRDIRFTDSDGRTLLSYYRVSIEGSTAIFEVRIPERPVDQATKQIYVYWSYIGTPGDVSDPSVRNILFRDEFDGSALDTSIWDVVGSDGQCTVSDGQLRISGSTAPYGIRSKLTTAAPAYLETSLKYEGDYGAAGAAWWGFVDPATLPSGSGNTDLPASLKRALIRVYGDNHRTFASTADGSSRELTEIAYGKGSFGTYTIQWDGSSATMAWASTARTLTSATTDPTKVIIARGNSATSILTIDYIRIYRSPPITTQGTWGPETRTMEVQDTKTLDGTIISIDAPETGDWVAVSTTTKTYIIEITDSGFGTVYSADRAGPPYAVAIANNGANLIEGRGALADIFRLDGAQVGTYTAGGPVRTVALAQKNGLYAAAGSDDGKYYIFSKDESSSWYLLHASDSEDPVTAIAMSWRGEIAVIGRADGSVVLYTTTDAPPPDSQMTVYIIKDGQPYIGKTVSVSTADISDPDEWTPLYNYLRTDSEGKIVISTHTGHYYQININNGEKIVVIQASSATPIHSVVFRSPLIYEKYNYDVRYNASSQAIEMAYTDNEGPATVSWSIVRTDTYSEVYSHTTSGATTATATYPISEPDISYKVNVKVQRSSGGSIQNMWFITPQNASPLALPFWDENIQNAVFIVFLMILGGVFYYSTGAKGALIVALVAALFRYFSWITVPWFWIIAAAVFAFLANIAEGA